MIVHGVDLDEVTALELAATNESASQLYMIWIRWKPRGDAFARGKVYRAYQYLHSIVEHKKHGPKRTFARDLMFPVGRDDDGNRLCRWCRKPVGNRKSYCDKECLKEVDIRCSQSMLRSWVKKRDKAICAECGLDTKTLKRIFSFARESYQDLMKPIDGSQSWGRSWFPMAEWERRLGFDAGKSYWACDHIVEFSEGGESTLENARTLCVPCHKAKTKAWRQRRARERRRQAQPALAFAV